MKEKKTKIKKDLFREIRSIRSDGKNTGITLIAFNLMLVSIIGIIGTIKYPKKNK